MASRPSMRARNSNGKAVSLLNDDDVSSGPQSASRYPTLSGQIPQLASVFPTHEPRLIRSDSGNSFSSYRSTPPDLIRSDSHDSQTTSGPHSPITPLPPMANLQRQPSYTSTAFMKEPSPLQYEQAYEQRSPFEDASRHYPPNMTSIRGPYPDHQRSSSYSSQVNYDSDSYANGTSVSERGIKRYPCRFKDSQNCDKTFTTSGHASRHSKIHTAEKGVNCSFLGCTKRFTRSDNMKQHLETHFKTKGRPSTVQKTTPAKSPLTKPSGIHKPTSSHTTSSRSEYSSHQHSHYEHLSDASETSASKLSSVHDASEMNDTPMEQLMPHRSSAALDVLAVAASTAS